jgi:hypothetical protein
MDDCEAKECGAKTEQRAGKSGGEGATGFKERYAASSSGGRGVEAIKGERIEGKQEGAIGVKAANRN